ncbi:hybrid sensor histidine kinase/response regulator [Methylobacter svalbardensis]|uniref:hybrid sensor histidine kinase/response regulator n=1 Tax=Methylobacter svalbardensis TaxID=3080016 RepID=UPI0030ED090A
MNAVLNKASIRLLLVEDDQVDRLACKRALAQHPDCDFVIFEAETGDQGLKLARTQQIDCILLDYHLPDLNGLEFLAELTEETGELPMPVVMLTGSDNAVVAVDALKLGVRDYVVKGSDRESLQWLPAVVFRALREQQAIQDKVEAVEQLREAEAKYRTLVEQIPAITYIASLESPGKLLYLSPQIHQLGFPPEDWLVDPQGLLKRVYADDRQIVIEAYALTYEHHAPLRCEYRLVKSDGQPRWFLDEANVVRDEAGGTLFLQGVLVDITKDKETEQELFYYRRRLEDLVARRTEQLEVQNAILNSANANLDKALCERKQAEQMLRDADQRKNVFLAMLGHELRNPLTPISNVAQLMRSQPLDEPTLAWACEVLNRNVTHISQLVDDLLDVSRITRGLVKIQRKLVELAQLLKDSAESVQTLTQTKHQTFNLELPTQPIYLEGDPVRLTQVFTNLFNNAAKYTGEGGRIDLSVSVDDLSVVVRVQDNGMGIEPQLLPHIFDLFIQGERGLDRSEGGLGLGLTLVKKLVELHDGQITAYSSGANQGSEFVVQLPRLVEATVQMEPMIPQALYRETDMRLRVLLIDDNPDVVDSLALWFETLGHQVEIAYHGTQGISTAQSFEPDIILLDIGLPDMDGYQVARKLREQPSTQRMWIIALSGYDQKKDSLGAESSGFDHYLMKPTNLSKLQELITEFQRIKPS